LLQIRGNSCCKIRGNCAVKINFGIICLAKFAQKVPDILAVICREKIAAILAENLQLTLRKIESFLCGNMLGNACVNQRGKLADFSCGKLAG
jgi:hypothetical protein